MASDPKAQWIVVNFSYTEGGKKISHGLRMKKGTADALGLNSSTFSVGFVEKTVQRPVTTRRLFPGAAPISVPASSKVQAVAVGPRQSRSRTNSKMFLRGYGANKNAVIYYSGKRAKAVNWLEDNTNIDWTLFGNTMGLYSEKGKNLVLKKAPIA
jgi:hypothetical protein